MPHCTTTNLQDSILQTARTAASYKAVCDPVMGLILSGDSLPHSVLPAVAAQTHAAVQPLERHRRALSMRYSASVLLYQHLALPFLRRVHMRCFRPVTC